MWTCFINLPVSSSFVVNSFAAKVFFWFGSVGRYCCGKNREKMMAGTHLAFCSHLYRNLNNKGKKASDEEEEKITQQIVIMRNLNPSENTKGMTYGSKSHCNDGVKLNKYPTNQTTSRSTMFHRRSSVTIPRCQMSRFLRCNTHVHRRKSSFNPW